MAQPGPLVVRQDLQYSIYHTLDNRLFQKDHLLEQHLIHIPVYFHEPHKCTIYHDFDNPATSASQGSRLTAATSASQGSRLTAATKKKQSNKPYHQVTATAAAQNKSKLQ